MSNFLKILAVALTLCSHNLHAQKNSLDESGMGNMFNESIAAFQVADSGAYGDLFMKKAELIDASGAVIIGRKAIVQWRQGLLKAEAHPIKREILTNRTRLLRPDLAVVVATTRITRDDQTGVVAYNYLFRRIDSKWYIETCAIVPVLEPAVVATK